MLPTPFKTRGLPTWYQQGDDAARDAMCAKLDANLEEWTADLVAELNLHRPDRCPADLLAELAYMLGITLLQSDSERQQRQKVAGAGAIRKNLGLWATCIKPLVDVVTGSSASLWSAPQWDWWVLVEGDEGILTSYYWGTIGEGADANITGMIVAEADVESINPGNVYIDVGMPGLSAAQVAQIVDSIGPLCPAYFRVRVGYASGGGFTTFAGGTIN